MALYQGFFRNIDSSIELGRETVPYSITGSWIHVLVHEMPVYLVNPDTMDRISPSERSTGIPVRRKGEVGNIIGEFMGNPSLRGIDEVFDKIEELSGNYSPLGVFIAPGNTRALDVSSRRIELPAIILCPERILDRARAVSKELGFDENRVFNALTRIVLAHEQAHAFSWKLGGSETYRKYNDAYIRIIEEVLAQMTAYTNPPEDIANRIMHEQLMLDYSRRIQVIEYDAWRILVPIMNKSRDVYANFYMYTSMVNTGRMDLLSVIAPYLSYPPHLPPIPYILRTLHTYYALLGPLAHQFYHDFIEPLARGLAKPEDVLKTHALTILYMYVHASK